MAKSRELVFAALGGAGEIGMNMYLYGVGAPKDRKWIIVDCGVTFGDMASSPGVELILPDIDFIAAQKDNLLGIFITHAHEDHIGAIGRWWRRLKAPVYCTPFTAEIAKRKLEEVGLPEKHIRTVKPHDLISLPPFDCSFFPVTHSIPEAMALVIRTPLGTVVHSGDFKLDPTPTIGAPTDEAGLAAIGREGVLALVCDSTNVFEAGVAGSEQSVREGLRKVIGEATGAVAVTTFASNVARLQTIAEAARDCDRSVVIAGRAMQRMLEAARETGVAPNFPPIISEDKASELPANHVLYLVTGSQGEGRAAVGRIANGSHPFITLEAGDMLVYSSSTIPGNERDVYRVYNQLSEQGVRVVDNDLADIHVSGHANRDELERLYTLLKPKISIPIHGEHRHLSEHVRAATLWGAGEAILAPNGTVVSIARSAEDVGARVVDSIDTGRVYLDGDAYVGALDGVIRDRLRLARNGLAVATLIIDEEGELIADPEVKLMGAPVQGENWPAPLDELIADALDDAMEKLPRKARLSDEAIEEAAVQVTRRLCNRYWGKKPETIALVMRLEEED